jgi:hypothetical protein
VVASVAAGGGPPAGATLSGNIDATKAATAKTAMAATAMRAATVASLRRVFCFVIFMGVMGIDTSFFCVALAYHDPFAWTSPFCREVCNVLSFFVGKIRVFLRDEEVTDENFFVGTQGKHEQHEQKHENGD